MIHFVCMILKNVIVSENSFKFNNNIFSAGAPTTNKFDDGIWVTYFSGL